MAATSFDVPALLTVLQQTGEGVAGAVLPAFMGGSQASLRHLFRPDGFFAYADDRQAQVGLEWIQYPIWSQNHASRRFDGMVGGFCLDVSVYASSLESICIVEGLRAYSAPMQRPATIM